MAMLDIIPVTVDEGTRARRLPYLPGLVLHHPSASDCQCLQVENAFMSVPCVELCTIDVSLQKYYKRSLQLYFDTDKIIVQSENT